MRRVQPLPQKGSGSAGVEERSHLHSGALRLPSV